MPYEVMLPVARVVWGHPAKLEGKTDPDTKQPVMKKDGSGQQAQVCSFGLAIPKDAFAAQVWPYMDAEAKSVYPNGAPQKFSWKYKDGDTATDSKGNPYNQMEGRAGCYILTISTEAFAPPVYKLENGVYRQLQANEIKCGDYVAVGVEIKANVPKSATHTPGLYINPKAVELVGYGSEIRSVGVDPMAMFGGQQRQLPPGASLTPQATPGAPMMPAMTPGAPQPGMIPQPVPMAAPAPAPMMAPQPVPVAAPAPVMQPGVMPQPAPMAPQMQPGVMPAPAPDFVNGIAGQPQMMQPAPMAPQPGMMPQPMPGQTPMPGMMPGR